MYLVSIYFDEKTNKILQGYISQVAKATGNRVMLDGKVPPHITISAFETKHPEKAIEKLDEITKKLSQGNLQWASVGAFFPYVLYLAPVLNEYLHDLSVKVYGGIGNLEETKLSPYYQPFHWLAHTTIGKKLEKEEMLAGFSVLQKNFVPLKGKVVRIGLAKTKPYQEIRNWELEEE